MRNELMQKVGELLDLAGLDEEVIKSVTEKLADENVVLEGEEEMEDETRAEESACPIKHEEPEVEAEDEKKAPVDPKANEGGYNAVAEGCTCGAKDEKECECKDKKDEDEEAEDDEVEVEKADEDLQEALGTLLDLVREAYEQTAQMKADFDVLKEEYAKLVAEKIIAEAAKEEEEEKGAEEDKAEEENAEEARNKAEEEKHEEEGDKDEAEGKKEEAKKEDKEADVDAKRVEDDEHKEKEAYDKAHESLEETANKIAEEVTTITEEVAPKTVKIAKAYSVFSNISESEEGTEVKKTRKAFTLFPNL